MKGFVRRFWQSCQYHRGTKEQPGRVVTLVEQGGKHPSECVYGVCYVVRESIALQIFGDLDIREQGGYVRKFVPIFVNQSVSCNKQQQEVIATNAYVYVSMSDNPELVENEEEEKIAAIISNVSVQSTGGWWIVTH